jgi:hypothetical protein
MMRSLVFVLANFFYRDELDTAILRDHVYGAVRQAETDRALALALALEWLVVKTRRLPHILEAEGFDRRGSRIKLVFDVTRYLTQILLGGSRDDHGSDHRFILPIA